MKISELRQLTNYLYHGTPFFQMASIISTDSIYGSQDEGEIFGISVTTDTEVAKAHSRGNRDNPLGGIIVFNSNNLKADYKISNAISDWQEVWDESEFVIETHNLSPLSKYMEYFVLPNSAFGGMVIEDGMFEQAAEYFFGGNVDATYKAVELMKHHPKRRN